MREGFCDNKAHAPGLDRYRDLAEFSLIFGRENPQPMPEISASIREKAAGGIVIELGGGTGRHTVTLARTLPESQVWTVESSPSMRAVLNAFLVENPDVLDRVTVEPSDIFAAQLPSHWSLVVGVHFLCQISAGERNKVWQLLHESLTPSGIAVFDRHYGPRSTSPVEKKLSATTRIGENVYERWFEMTPINKERLRTSVTYRMLRGDTMIREAVTVGEHSVIDESTILAELATCGLASELSDNWLIVSRC